MRNSLITLFYCLVAFSSIQLGQAQSFTNQICEAEVSTKGLREIKLDEFRKIILFDGQSILASEMKYIDLRADQSIDMIYLNDNTVIDRTDIYNASGVNKEPRESDRISPDQLRITVPEKLRRELLGVDGGGMTIPSEVLKNIKKK
jgi:hypothetical protein